MTILLGFSVTNTLITLAPSQQYHSVYLESSLLNLPATRFGGSRSSSVYGDDQNIAINPDIVIKWDHWKDMERIVDSIWGGSRFCDTVKQKMDTYYNESMVALLKAINGTGTKHLRSNDVSFKQIPIPNIYVHFEFSCYDLYKHSRHGTGNYIQAIYYMRLAVKYIPNVQLKLNITCLENDSPEFYTNYVLPWFTGVWYTPVKTTSRVTERIRILLHTQRLKSYYVQYDNYCGQFNVNPTARSEERRVGTEC